MAGSAVLLKPNIANILLSNFLWTKISSTWLNNDRHWLSRPPLVHFRRKMASGSKFASKQWLVLGASAYQYVRAGFPCSKWDNICLFTYPPKSKWASSEKMILLPKSAPSLSRSVEIFPSVVQEYTQPYSFGGRIKLIICQIRHELSVTIYEIRTSWKKKR